MYGSAGDMLDAVVIDPRNVRADLRTAFNVVPLEVCDHGTKRHIRNSSVTAQTLVLIVPTGAALTVSLAVVKAASRGLAVQERSPQAGWVSERAGDAQHTQ